MDQYTKKRLCVFRGPRGTTKPKPRARTQKAKEKRGSHPEGEGGERERASSATHAVLARRIVSLFPIYNKIIVRVRLNDCLYFCPK